MMQHTPTARPHDRGDVYAAWGLPENADPRFHQFVDYWKSKCGPDEEPPLFQDIDPLEISALMPGIVIIDQIRDAEGHGRYFYRYVGTSHYEANQIELTGRFVDEIYSQDVIGPVFEVLNKILEDRLLHYWRRLNPIPQREFTYYERVMLPLRNNKGEVTMLIGYWIWY